MPEDVRMDRGVRRFGRSSGWVPGLERIWLTHRPDVVYAWGSAAAAVVMDGHAGWPIVVVLSDPADAGRYGERRCGGSALGDTTKVLCTSRTVRGRLTDAGVPIAETAVIRPGVDLEVIRQSRETIRRADIGLPAGAKVLLTASPPSRAGGSTMRSGRRRCCGRSGLTCG